MLKKKIKNFNKIVFALYLILLCIGRYLRYQVLLSTSFSGMSDNILAVIKTGKSAINDKTVYLIGMLLRKINFLNFSTFWEYEIFFLIITNILFVMFLYKNRNMIKQCNVMDAILLLLSIILLNSYVFAFVKDIVILLGFYIIYLTVLSKKIKSNKTKYVLLLSEVALLSVYVKTYYFLILIFFVVIYLFMLLKEKGKLRIKSEAINYLLLITVISIIYIIVTVFLKSYSMDYYSKLISVSQSDYLSANSRITPWFTGDNYISLFLNYITKCIRIAFPIELFKLGIKYVPFILFQSILTGYAINNIKEYKKLTFENKIFLVLFWAFLFTSAAFEPDFGSWLRHELSIFFVIWGVVFYKFRPRGFTQVKQG